MTNPLLAEWRGPFGLPDFTSVRDEDFAPAYETALRETRAAIDAIAADPAPPTFANTIAAMERADTLLDRVGSIFWNLASADTNDAREALQRDLSPKLAAFHAETMMNRALFARIDPLAAKREGLTPEEDRVLTLYHDMFVRSGARLEGAARDRLKAIMERLATLGTRFSQNLLADEKAWELPLGPEDLAGLPDFVVSAAAGAARERGHDGHVVTLSRSLIVPFLQFSPRRDLREQAFRAWGQRGESGGPTDNRAIVTEMLALREERARLLGFDNFAAFKLDKEM
ncbi:MAG TPA: M3 family metallopeptidase, partial [Paracoccaceae bacterium]|nr:M3 family metallopeptidase [Paracoccaceae bacterium]